MKSHESVCRGLFFRSLGPDSGVRAEPGALNATAPFQAPTAHGSASRSGAPRRRRSSADLGVDLRSDHDGDHPDLQPQKHDHNAGGRAVGVVVAGPVGGIEREE